MEIMFISYEESRLYFFKQERDRAAKRYERISKSKDLVKLPKKEQHRLLSDFGIILSYWNDIVKMLEDNMKQ